MSAIVPITFKFTRTQSTIKSGKQGAVLSRYLQQAAWIQYF